MPAKTRSPRAPKSLNIQERFKAHLEASQECGRWAKKGLKLIAAGRIAEARAAQEKAHWYMARMKELEPGSHSQR